MAIYLDNQASSPLDENVLKQMSSYGLSSFGNPHSEGHVIGWSAARVVEEARDRVAAMIGCDGNELVFTSGATEANNIAILGFRSARGMAAGVMVRSAIEHKSVISAFDHLESEHGYTVRIADVDSRGGIRINEFEKLLSEGADFCSISVVNSEIGTIQDVESIGSLCRRYGAVFHCDAAQAVTAMDISSLSRHADLISLSAHKMNGPMGIGALYVSHDTRDRIKPIMFGGGQQGGLRPGTVPVPLCLGMGAATVAATGEEGTRRRQLVASLRDRFWENLQESGIDVELNGPELPDRHPGNINILFKGVDALELLGTVQPRVAASSGSACTSGIPEPSYVLRAIGLDAEQASSSLRFSFGQGNTMEDAERAATILSDAVKRIRLNH